MDSVFNLMNRYLYFPYSSQPSILDLPVDVIYEIFLMVKKLYRIAQTCKHFKDVVEYIRLSHHNKFLCIEEEFIKSDRAMKKGRKLKDVQCHCNQNHYPDCCCCCYLSRPDFLKRDWIRLCYNDAKGLFWGWINKEGMRMHFVIVSQFGTTLYILERWLDRQSTNFEYDRETETILFPSFYIKLNVKNLSNLVIYPSSYRGVTGLSESSFNKVVLFNSRYKVEHYFGGLSFIDRISGTDLCFLPSTCICRLDRLSDTSISFLSCHTKFNWLKMKEEPCFFVKTTFFEELPDKRKMICTQNTILQQFDETVPQFFSSDDSTKFITFVYFPQSAKWYEICQNHEVVACHAKKLVPPKNAHHPIMSDGEIVWMVLNDENASESKTNFIITKFVNCWNLNLSSFSTFRHSFNLL